MKALFLAVLLSAAGGIFAQTEPLSFSLNLSSGSLNLSSDLWKPVPLAGGTGTADSAKPEESIFAGAPLWVKDLRRGEIVFFGSLPFTIFFTRTFMDLWRSANHNWDSRYAPWPFKAAGAVPMSTGELGAMFGIALSASLVIAVADHLVVRHKRNRQAE